MLRTLKSKTFFWRSSWCGGRGCWWRSSRIRFMGISLPLGGEGALLTALLQRGQEPSDRRDGRFSATLRAEGGTHRPCAYCIKYSKPFKHSAMHPSLRRTILVDVRRSLTLSVLFQRFCQRVSFPTSGSNQT